MAELDAAFRESFGHEPEAHFFAPGRVNLIGEHTDYNAGLVLPVATHLGCLFTTGRNDDGLLRVVSDAFADEHVTIPVDGLEAAAPRGHWSDYVIGTARELLAHARQACGVDMHIATDLPHGGGLSSSAAITVGVATALDAIWDCGLSRPEIARYAQAAENHFVGMQCGILDPFAIAMGQAGCALFVDCGSLDFEPITFPDAYTIVVAHTGVRRELAASAYNERRQECEAAARMLSGDGLERPLSAFTAADVDKLDEQPVLLKRARHVVTENERVRQAVRALEAGDVERFGELLLASHESLRSDYEVSCEELDIMVEEAAALGAAGAKMTGGGFGGAAVAVVRRDAAAGFATRLKERYRERAGRVAEIFQCDPADGARRLDNEARV